MAAYVTIYLVVAFWVASRIEEYKDSLPVAIVSSIIVGLSWPLAVLEFLWSIVVDAVSIVTEKIMRR